MGYTVQTLATLCLIAARTKPDFRLDDTESNIDFKYLVAPSSFRASLGQIGNEGFYAFREAHNAMHDIQIRTSQFKGYLDDILTIVFKKNSDSGIKYLLPTTLNQTLEIVEDSTQRVEDVVNKFDRTLKVVNEVYIASLAKQGKTQRMNEKLEKTKQEEQEKKRQAEKRLEKKRQDLEKKTMEIIANKIKFQEIQQNLTQAER